MVVGGGIFMNTANLLEKTTSVTIAGNTANDSDYADVYEP